MISLIGNRPAIQIGRYQVIDYDTAWLDDALYRAAVAAEHEDFPFVAEIRSGNPHILSVDLTAIA